MWVFRADLWPWVPKWCAFPCTTTLCSQHSSAADMLCVGQRPPGHFPVHSDMSLFSLCWGSRVSVTSWVSLLTLLGDLFVSQQTPLHFCVGGQTVHMCIRKSEDTEWETVLSSHPVPSGAQRNSGCQAWWQGPVPAEPTSWPYAYFWLLEIFKALTSLINKVLPSSFHF